MYIESPRTESLNYTNFIFSALELLMDLKHK